MTPKQIKNISIENDTIEALVETHASWIVLTPKFVFKIKKTIQYSFLDFSTLEKRKHFCEEELRLNRRLTEGMYLEVVPITQVSSDFFIGKKPTRWSDWEGDIVDYALKMIRIKADRQMHLLLEKNEVTENDIAKIAERLVPFHQAAKIINRPLDLAQQKENFNDIRSIQDFVNKELGKDLGEIISQSIEFSNQFLDENISLLEKRIEQKMIRDGHGDLHSSNIFIDAEPIIFDCIEFNSGFREIDILNELAFFCIDLDAYKHEDFSRFFIKKYKALFPEVMQGEEEERLFLYYKLYRANVRAKVNALKAMQFTNEAKKKTTLAEITTYLHLMKKYLSQLRVQNLELKIWKSNT